MKDSTDILKKQPGIYGAWSHEGELLVSMTPPTFYRVLETLASVRSAAKVSGYTGGEALPDIGVNWSRYHGAGVQPPRFVYRFENLSERDVIALSGPLARLPAGRWRQRRRVARQVELVETFAAA